VKVISSPFKLTSYENVWSICKRIFTSSYSAYPSFPIKTVTEYNPADKSGTTKVKVSVSTILPVTSFYNPAEKYNLADPTKLVPFTVTVSPFSNLESLES
jgi:hypothetical protein